MQVTPADIPSVRDTDSAAIPLHGVDRCGTCEIFEIVFDCPYADVEFRRQILHGLKPSITERFQDFLPAFKSASHVPHLLSSFDGVIVESKGAR